MKAATKKKAPAVTSATTAKAASALSSARWAKPEWKTKAARAKFAKYVSDFGEGKREGRPRSADRCPCGAMTKARAAKRNHRCKAA